MSPFRPRLALVVAVGLLCLTGACPGPGPGPGSGGSGGGTGGGGSPADSGPSGPLIPGFSFSLATGDFWEFGWDMHWYSSTYCGGSPGVDDEKDSGSFRVTLGAAMTVAGVQAYAVELTGKSQGTAGLTISFAPRWTSLAVADNKLLGSSDGVTLQTLFDASTGKWPGGGFFLTFPGNSLVVAKAGSVSNAYLQDDEVWVVGRSTNTSQCTYYPGVGTICGSNWSTNTLESEYYAAGTGPVAYRYSTSGGNDDGTCSTSYQGSRNVGLMASSGFTVFGGNGNGGGNGGGASGGGGGSGGGSGAGSGTACTPPASVPASEIPAYVPVVQRLNACSASQLSSFVAACLDATATATSCDDFQNASSNVTCLACLFPTTTNSGGMLDDATGHAFISANTPGCLAVADATYGPPCATVLEPWLQCYAVACASAACRTSSNAYDACISSVDASGGACYAKLAASHNTACGVMMASGGVYNTRCGSSTQVLNAICGTGP
jgi:hypothetical protein